MNHIVEVNKHGVRGVWYETSHWGHHDKDGKWHNALTFVPDICLNCGNFDIESGEYGDYLTPPYCLKNVWFPTKTNACKKSEPIRSTRWLKRYYSEGAD